MVAFAQEVAFSIDGTVSKSGCSVVNGTVIETLGVQSEPIQVCKFANKVLKIVEYKGCTENIVETKDPDTGVSYGFPTPCHVPISCTPNYSWNIISGIEHYDMLPVEIEERKYTINLASEDGVCSSLVFIPAEKKIGIILKGIWENMTTISVYLPKELMDGEFTVTVDDHKVNPQIREFSDYCEPYLPDCRIEYYKMDIEIEQTEDQRKIDILGTRVIPEFSSPGLIILAITLSFLLFTRVRSKLIWKSN